MLLSASLLDVGVQKSVPYPTKMPGSATTLNKRVGNRQFQANSINYTEQQLRGSTKDVTTDKKNEKKLNSKRKNNVGIFMKKVYNQIDGRRKK